MPSLSMISNGQTKPLSRRLSGFNTTFYAKVELSSVSISEHMQGNSVPYTSLLDRLQFKMSPNYPLASIFEATQSNRIQLITCAGPYDENLGYRNRIVVTAHLIEP